MPFNWFYPLITTCISNKLSWVVECKYPVIDLKSKVNAKEFYLHPYSRWMRKSSICFHTRGECERVLSAFILKVYAKEFYLHPYSRWMRKSSICVHTQGECERVLSAFILKVNAKEFYLRSYSRWMRNSSICVHTQLFKHLEPICFHHLQGLV